MKKKNKKEAYRWVEVFKKDADTTVWRCINCGYLHEGAAAPEMCSACAHPRSYYEVLGENW